MKNIIYTLILHFALLFLYLILCVKKVDGQEIINPFIIFACSILLFYTLAKYFPLFYSKKMRPVIRWVGCVVFSELLAYSYLLFFSHIFAVDAMLSYMLPVFLAAFCLSFVAHWQLYRFFGKNRLVWKEINQFFMHSTKEAEEAIRNMYVWLFLFFLALLYVDIYLCVLLFFIFSYRDMEQILESLKQSPYVTAWQLRFSMCMYGGFLLLSIICDNYFYPTTLVFIFALFSVFFLQVNLKTISLLQQEHSTG